MKYYDAGGNELPGLHAPEHGVDGMDPLDLDAVGAQPAGDYAEGTTELLAVDTQKQVKALLLHLITLKFPLPPDLIAYAFKDDP